ncbi:ATP-dependent DNA helicase pif1-like [Gigaspora margarita]|uniref:ATP-dependent DNA helicase pif1-like n=1 Tax=Gigaspora margarita TaxID=4874 RepID=A0A8H4AJF4_GIGMA|nr:ATP-dependent DNA helicase pif1-like [Gigaspora margarita]
MSNMRNKRASAISPNMVNTNVNDSSENNLPIIDCELLQKFRDTINKLKNSQCKTCYERFSSIDFFGEEYHRCYNEKVSSKKFLTENSMDPGEVPQELTGLRIE